MERAEARVTDCCSRLLMTKFSKDRKSDYPVCQIGVTSFDSFRAKPGKELNLKI
jgi:hypothetical protein